MKNKIVFILSIAASTAAFSTPHALANPSADLSAKKNGYYTTFGLGFSSPKPTPGHQPTHYGYSIYGEVDKDNGFSGEAGAGYRLGSVRVEVTYSYNYNAFNTSIASASGVTERSNLTGYMSTHTALISGYYDFKTPYRFEPYIGGGIGYANVAPSKVTYLLEYGTGVSDPAKNGVIAYRAKVGVTYPVSNQFNLFAEGVYLGSISYAGSGGFAPGISDMGSSNAYGAKAGIRYFMS